MFNLQYIAASLGVNVKSGGLSIKEEEVTAALLGGKVSVTETPVAFDGTLMGWYKRPTDADWKIGTFEGKDMTISGAKPKEVYCVKYFYVNEDAQSITIKTQYVPAELHVVIINDLFAGDGVDMSTATRYGRLITDIPRLQMDGNQDLSLTASGAATVSLTGNALAVTSRDTCEEDPYYGTMTQEIYGATWKDSVIALAVENGDIDMTSGETETLAIRAIFGSAMLPERKANSNFTFAIEEAPASTAVDTQVDPETGVITAGSTPGSCVVSVTLKEAPHVDPAYVLVTVAGA